MYQESRGWRLTELGEFASESLCKINRLKVSDGSPLNLPAKINVH